MRAIQNQKFYTYLGGSSRVCDFFLVWKICFYTQNLA